MPSIHQPVSAEDIQWHLAPLPSPENVDLLGLDDTQLLDYARDLQRDLRSVRALLHETMTALARTVEQRDRALFIIQQTRRQSRAAMLDAA